jgi:outer membrane protein insertion porin family
MLCMGANIQNSEESVTYPRAKLVLKRRVRCSSALAVVAICAACSAATTPAARRYQEFAQYAGKEVNRVTFHDTGPLHPDTLRSIIQTQPTHCSIMGLPICLPFTSLGTQRHYLSLDVLARDVQRIVLYYRRSGYYGTRVRPAVTASDGGRAVVDFFVTPGREVRLEALKVSGTDTIFNADSLAASLPLKPGDLFDLNKFEVSTNAVEQALFSRGHVYAKVLRNYSVDTVSATANAALEAVPGPQVHVDSILVRGAEHLGRIGALHQITIRPGDLLRLSNLVESQRNLYSLELVQFASVTIAPDSISPVTDSTRATVLVQVAEAPVHQVETAAGYGSVECFRSDGRWVNRSFGGGARRLAVQASIAKLGTSTGLGSSNICGAYTADIFRNNIDYRLATDLTQPYFVSPRNHLTLSAFTERQSEPTIYQRIAQGGRFAVDHRLSNRAVLTSIINIEHSRTIASPALFCLAFQSCVPELVDSLANARWRNSLGLSLVQNHTNAAFDPSNGYLLRADGSWSTHLLATTTSFLRGTGEAAFFKELRTSIVFAARLRLGTFFRTAGLSDSGRFLAPDERFYAGGANSVRGYDTNALGPVAYILGDKDVHVVKDANGNVEDLFTVRTDTATGKVVTTHLTPRLVPVGGTALTLANLELRMPSPFLANYVRLAAFVDGGAVGEGNVWNLGGRAWKATPGFGFRAQTPVGPVRLDIAYNPYPPTYGGLYVQEPGSNALVRVTDRYRPAVTSSFFGKLHFHLAVGQAF